MTNKIKLPCGIDKDGNIVYIKDAIKGQDCGCFCPGCKQPLVAKKGDVREQHFAHKSKDFDCEQGFQSALHYMAKDIFIELEYLIFIKNGKPVPYKIDSVELECKVNEIIPDIIVICDGKRFIVEIFVTHAVDEIKKQKIKDMRISAIEIDLSKYPRDNLNKENLKKVLQSADNYSWVYDADRDLIGDKKSIIDQFGLKLLFQVDNAICCPLLINQKNQFARCVTLNFCLHCPNCVWDGKSRFIKCGRILPILVNNETRAKILPQVFVNDNKVLFKSDFEKYNTAFGKQLENAMKQQYYRFQQIAVNMYSTQVNYSLNKTTSTRRNYNRSYSYHHKKR